MTPPPLHELACLRNALNDRQWLSIWRWQHRTPRNLREKIEREADSYKSFLTCLDIARIERVTACAADAWRRLFRTRFEGMKHG